MLLFQQKQAIWASWLIHKQIVGKMCRALQCAYHKSHDFIYTKNQYQLTLHEQLQQHVLVILI